MMEKSKVLALYRNILRLHRTKLDPQMRVLGDRYVREEFKLHKTAKEDFVKGFLNEWQQYHAMLKERENAFGQDLSPEEQNLLDQQQQNMLKELKDAATNALHHD